MTRFVDVNLFLELIETVQLTFISGYFSNEHFLTVHLINLHLVTLLLLVD